MMEQQMHYSSGFFASREAAEQALSELLSLGLRREQIEIFDAISSETRAPPRTDSNEVLKNMIFDGALGTAIGTGLGVLAELALVVGNVSLFIASPLLAPLMLMGWGASVGGMLGVATGTAARAGSRKGLLADLINDAISIGQVVVVVETWTDQDRARAQQVMTASVGGRQDVDLPIDRADHYPPRALGLPEAPRPVAASR